MDERFDSTTSSSTAQLASRDGCPPHMTLPEQVIDPRFESTISLSTDEPTSRERCPPPTTTNTLSLSRRNLPRNKRKQLSFQWFVDPIIKVHCVCRTERRIEPMIQCDRCIRWYHFDCIGLNKSLLNDEIELSDIVYICGLEGCNAGKTVCTLNGSVIALTQPVVEISFAANISTDGVSLLHSVNDACCSVADAKSVDDCTDDAEKASSCLVPNCLSGSPNAVKIGSDCVLTPCVPVVSPAMYELSADREESVNETCFTVSCEPPVLEGSSLHQSVDVVDNSASTQ